MKNDAVIIAELENEVSELELEVLDLRAQMHKDSLKRRISNARAWAAEEKCIYLSGLLVARDLDLQETQTALEWWKREYEKLLESKDNGD